MNKRRLVKKWWRDGSDRVHPLRTQIPDAPFTLMVGPAVYRPTTSPQRRNAMPNLSYP